MDCCDICDVMLEEEEELEEDYLAVCFCVLYYY